MRLFIKHSKQLLASSISVTRGGLAMALAKKQSAACWGLKCRLKTYLATPAVTILHFIRKPRSHPCHHRKENKAAFEKIMQGNAYTQIWKSLPKIPNSSSKACKKKS